MLECYFEDETNILDDAGEKEIEALLQFAAGNEGLQGVYEVSITFVDDQTIQQINAEYRQKDVPTDVISFALEELGEDEVPIIADEQMPTLLGDIIISVDTAKSQAEQYNHSLRRELGFLALHGFLHLLGYDHMTEEDEKKMFARQKELLSAFGLER